MEFSLSHKVYSIIRKLDVRLTDASGYCRRFEDVLKDIDNKFEMLQEEEKKNVLKLLCE